MKILIECKVKHWRFLRIVQGDDQKSLSISIRIQRRECSMYRTIFFFISMDSLRVSVVVAFQLSFCT